MSIIPGQRLCVSDLDRERLARAYRAYSTRLRSCIAARLGRYDFHLTEDLAAETWLRVVRQIPLYRGSDDRMMPWLMGIARNVIRESNRRNRREVTDFSNQACAYRLAPAPSAEDVVFWRALAESVADPSLAVAALITVGGAR